jgi:hypothetical protein
MVLMNSGLFRKNGMALLCLFTISGAPNLCVEQPALGYFRHAWFQHGYERNANYFVYPSRLASPKSPTSAADLVPSKRSQIRRSSVL